MKIFCYDDDPRRKTDPNYFYNKGSFAQITDGLNSELEKRDLLGTEQDAEWVGFASGLKLDFGFHDRRRFLIHVFETNKLPDMFLRWREQTTTKVFGLSKQISDVWKSYGFDTPVVDIGVNKDFWAPTPDIKKFDQFTVLSVTSCNFRSGVPELLLAFELAFGSRKDVRLVIKNTDERATRLADIVNDMREDGINVSYQCERISAFDMYALMARSHLLVYVPLNTSAGLPILEAGSMELPVVTCDYCPTNIYPSCARIPCLDRPISTVRKAVCDRIGLPYTFPEGMINENEALMHCPDVEKLAQVMLDAYKDYSKMLELAYGARREIWKNWTWEHSCNQLIWGVKNVL